MTLDEFRILHSTLIEHYQFMEAHLEGIYATLSGKPFWEGLQDVEKASLPLIIKEIKSLEAEKKISVFTDDEYEQLLEIIKRRNFWCHNCYYTLVFDVKTKAPKKPEYMQKMVYDLQQAESWREFLLNKKMSLPDYTK